MNATGHRGWKPVVSLVAAAANKPTSEVPHQYQCYSVLGVESYLTTPGTVRTGRDLSAFQASLLDSCPGAPCL